MSRKTALPRRGRCRDAEKAARAFNRSPAIRHAIQIHMRAMLIRSQLGTACNALHPVKARGPGLRTFERMRRPFTSTVQVRTRLRTACSSRKLHPYVPMMQSAQHWCGDNGSALVDGASQRRVLAQPQVCARLIVPRGLRTPTGPFFARFFIGIILGLVAEFAFIVQSTRMVLSSSAARWKSRKQIGGSKCRPGCSTGRHVLSPVFWQLNRMSASRHLRRSPFDRRHVEPI
jgi:hypothetical protein